MNLMNTPQFLITQYLDNTKYNSESIRKVLLDNGILTKFYPEKKLMVLYHKYDTPVNSDLERECRSLVIDSDTFKILSYSCEMPRLNKDGMDFLLSNPSSQQIITECYEGTYLSVFYHNGEWFVSTRRCLDSNESQFNKDLSHFAMFEETLVSAGYKDFTDFTQHLNQDNSYYFVLIHHKNKHVIDYNTRFGTEYKKLCLTTIRDSNMMELDMPETISFLSDTIFLPKNIDSINDFVESNKTERYDIMPQSEGIIIKVYNSVRNLYNLIKLQYNVFQFNLVLGNEHNIFKGLVYLYQHSMLATYFTNNSNTSNIKKIVNPLNTSESYDTIGMIDAIFKVVTSELFELFKNLWSLKTGKQQNKNLYDILPKEYKDMLYGVRGLYFKKRALLFNPEKKLDDVRDSHLKISDVYNYLKTIPSASIVSLLRMRKLMFNWLRVLDSSPTVTSSLVDFGTISKFCDKVHTKLCAIFTNKLFPNIMPTDIPPKNSYNYSETEETIPAETTIPVETTIPTETTIPAETVSL